MNPVNLDDPALLRWRASTSDSLTLALLPEHVATLAYYPTYKDLDYLRALPYIADQMSKLDASAVIAELNQYDYWNTSNHETNLTRLLLLAASDLI